MLLRLLFFTLFLSAVNVFSQIPTIDAGVSQTLAKWRAANYSDVRYKLNITLEKRRAADERRHRDSREFDRNRREE